MNSEIENIKKQIQEKYQSPEFLKIKNEISDLENQIENIQNNCISNISRRSI